VERIKLIAAQIEAERKLSLNQLTLLLGKNPATTEIDTNSFSYRQYRINMPASLPANLLAKRPDIHASRLRAEAAAHKINVAKARFFPNINLNALFSYQSVVTGQLFNPASQNNAITGAIDLPVFDAGARRANLGARYAEYDLAVNDYNQTILVALREVADQVASLKSIHAQLRAQKTSLNAYEKKFKLTSSSYKHGIVDYTQFLESKNSVLQQRAINIYLQSRYLQTVVAMMKALGGNG
jgi:NodT family efflux transporter outer membrane factor (OMF) lipoprotein